MLPFSIKIFVCFVLGFLFILCFSQEAFAAACNKNNGGEQPLEFEGGRWQASRCFESCTNLYVRRWAKWDCAVGDSGCPIEDATAVCTYEVAYDNNTCPESSRSNKGCGTWCSAVGTIPCTPGAANCKCSDNEVCVDNTDNATPTQICSGSYGSPHGYCVQYACGYHCLVGGPAPANECTVAYAPFAPSYGFDSKAACDPTCDIDQNCNEYCQTTADCGPGQTGGGLICTGSRCRNPSSPNDPTCAGVVAPNPPPGPNPGPIEWKGCGDACTSDAQCRKDQPERFCNGVCTGGTCAPVDTNQCNKECTPGGNECNAPGYICVLDQKYYCRLSICPANSNCNCGGPAPAPTATPTPTPTPTPRPFLQTTGGNVHSN